MVSLQPCDTRNPAERVCSRIAAKIGSSSDNSVNASLKPGELFANVNSFPSGIFKVGDANSFVPHGNRELWKQKRKLAAKARISALNNLSLREIGLRRK